MENATTTWGQCLQRLGRGVVFTVLLLAVAAKLSSPLSIWSCASVAFDLVLSAVCFLAWRRSFLWVLGLYCVFAAMTGYHLWLAPGQQCNCFGSLDWLNRYVLLICVVFCAIVVASWYLPFSKLPKNSQWVDAAICLTVVAGVVIVGYGDQGHPTCRNQAESIVEDKLATMDSSVGKVVCFGDLDWLECREKLRQVSWVFGTGDQEVVFFCQRNPDTQIIREFATRAKFFECDDRLSASCRSPLVFLVGEDREGVECLDFFQ